MTVLSLEGYSSREVISNRTGLHLRLHCLVPLKLWFSAVVNYYYCYYLRTQEKRRILGVCKKERKKKEKKERGGEDEH